MDAAAESYYQASRSSRTMTQATMLVERPGLHVGWVYSPTIVACSGSERWRVHPPYQNLSAGSARPTWTSGQAKRSVATR